MTWKYDDMLCTIDSLTREAIRDGQCSLNKYGYIHGNLFPRGDFSMSGDFSTNRARQLLECRGISVPENFIDHIDVMAPSYQFEGIAGVWVYLKQPIKITDVRCNEREIYTIVECNMCSASLDVDTLDIYHTQAVDIVEAGFHKLFVLQPTWISNHVSFSRYISHLLCEESKQSYMFVPDSGADPIDSKSGWKMEREEASLVGKGYWYGPEAWAYHLSHGVD